MVRKQIMEREQETTHSLVSKFSKEMINLIQVKEREVLVSIYKNRSISLIQRLRLFEELSYDLKLYDTNASFTRLNIGKIPLTEAELVRALFLRRAAQDDETLAPKTEPSRLPVLRRAGYSTAVATISPVGASVPRGPGSAVMAKVSYWARSATMACWSVD